MNAHLPTARSKHPLSTPLAVDKIKDEKGVKSLIKRLLEHHGWFQWMPPANGYGKGGIADHNALKHGVFLSIEAKFGTNKPKELQVQFAQGILAQDGYAFCVNERNIDHLAWFLESFTIATECRQHGREIPADHGARMLNAIAVLTELFQ